MSTPALPGTDAPGAHVHPQLRNPAPENRWGGKVLRVTGSTGTRGHGRPELR